MKFRLVVRPQAELEILEAAEYYEAERGSLGLEFLDKLDQAKTSLAGHPQFYFNTKPELSQRRYLLIVFPTQSCTKFKKMKLSSSLFVTLKENL